MDGKTVLTQYIVTDWKLYYINSTDHSQGLQVLIVMKRRIMNELMTTYLPTLLILIIVYTTNFFKAFFFEAVVTVNLTALLVLTTLFISVSGSLPPTSYVKMVDIWLIFAQMIPFFEVLLHTFIDNMRNDDEREINHHGVSLTVNGDDSDSKYSGSKTSSNSHLGDSKSNLIFINEVVPSHEEMVSRDEKKLVEARKKFYQGKSHTDWVRMGEFTARCIIPFCIIGFSVIYWSYGLNQYFRPQTL